MNYSKELILKVKSYWKKGFNKELTEDKASQYLDSLASLFLSFGKVNEEKKTK